MQHRARVKFQQTQQTIYGRIALLQDDLGTSLRVAPGVPHSALESRIAFIALAALSATLVLCSSVALIPVAVQAWGEEQTLGLLMLGWFAGAKVACFIGRRFGRCLTEYFVAARTLDRYGYLLAGELSVTAVAILKLSLPSEMRRDEQKSLLPLPQGLTGL